MSSSQPVYFNPEALAEIAMMDEQTQAGLMASVIEQFVSTYETFSTKVVDSFSSKDFKSLNSTAHSLKSSAMQLGLEHLGEVCFKIEQQAKAGSCGSELIEQLKMAGKPSLAALNEYLVNYLKKAS